MICFKLWGNFACFRDPFSISQNVSYPIPPKTTITGILASILGESNYLENIDYSKFQYSIILINPIRKKSFSQNYINDYTKRVNSMLGHLQKPDFNEIKNGFRTQGQKPTNRELLIQPKYLVFIDNFKLEDTLTSYLKDKKCKYHLYLGNSEFAGNFEYLPILQNPQKISLQNSLIHSFILEEDASDIDYHRNLELEAKYLKLNFPTCLQENRSPKDYKSIIINTQPSFSIYIKKIECTKIIVGKETYYCKFI